MTDDGVEQLKRKIGDLLCSTLRVGGWDRLSFTVGELLETASAFGTDDYDDAGDTIADMLYTAVFGMRIREAYSKMEDDAWTSRPLYISARLDSPSGDQQQVEIRGTLLTAQEFFEIEVSVELCFECIFPNGNTGFYTTALHRYPLGDVRGLRCVVTELHVRARPKAMAQGVMVPLADIGIECIRDMGPADLAVANGYEWMHDQVIVSALQMGL